MPKRKGLAGPLCIQLGSEPIRLPTVSVPDVGTGTHIQTKESAALAIWVRSKQKTVSKIPFSQ